MQATDWLVGDARRTGSGKGTALSLRKGLRLLQHGPAVEHGRQRRPFCFEQPDAGFQLLDPRFLTREALFELLREPQLQWAEHI